MDLLQIRLFTCRILLVDFQVDDAILLIVNRLIIPHTPADRHLILVLLKLPEHSGKLSKTDIVRLIMHSRIFILFLRSASQILLLDLIQYLPYDIDVGVHVPLGYYEHVRLRDEAGVLTVEELEDDSEDFEVLFFRCCVASCG